MITLPPELLVAIFRYCQTSSHFSLILTCKYFNIIFIDLINPLYHIYGIRKCIDEKKNISILSLIKRKINNENSVILPYCCLKNNIDLVREILKDPYVDPTLDNYLSLEAACDKNNVEIVKLLFNDPRVSLDKESVAINHSLRAVLNENIEIIKLFLEKCEDRCDMEMCIFSFSCEYDKPKILNWILENSIEDIRPIYNFYLNLCISDLRYFCIDVLLLFPKFFRCIDVMTYAKLIIAIELIDDNQELKEKLRYKSKGIVKMN